MHEGTRDILLVEDEPAHVEAIRRALEPGGNGMRLRVVTSLRGFRDAVAARSPDLALLDLNLPDGRAVDALSTPPEAGCFPVLIMTSFGDEQIAVKALKAGALDYLVKSPETFGSLPRIVERALREWALLRERREAQAELRRSAERWQSTFDAIADTICVLSREHEIVDINKAGNALLGRSRQQIIGHKCFRVVHGREAPLADCPCVIASRTRQPSTTVYQQAGRTFELIAWPRFADDGSLLGFVHIVRDISAQVAAARDKERLEEQLLQAQRLEAVGQLAGGVAHDFNNLLSVILNGTSFALERLQAADPVRADLQEVQQAAERAAALTRQLLAFSRKQVLQPELISLNTVVQGIESMLRRLLGETIEIAVRLDEGLGCTLADPGQLEQVIVNLAVNARDAMPGGGKLTIETADVELDEPGVEPHLDVEPGSYVMLAVTDTGCGMDAATRARLFEPFFTTKGPGRGTGLGLATVYGIVKQSRGYIWVYSEPGQGTTFKVYLPWRERPAAPLRPRPVASPPTRGHETLLVVEDEAAVRRVAERILKAAGYSVLCAADGDEALRLCAQQQCEIALMITDVVMPQMSGKELADRLGKLYPRLRVLFMSGYTDDAIVHHGVLDPGTHFIGKPFARDELARKVREVLDAPR